MSAKNKNVEIQAKIIDVQKRRQELVVEAQALKAAIEERAGELPKIYFERGDVTKLLEAQTSDTKRLSVLRDSIAIADQTLAGLGGELYAEKLHELAVSKTEFNDRFVRFVDGPLKAALAEFEEISKHFNTVMNLASQAGERAMYPKEDFPFVQKHLYDFLYFYFNPHSLPTDLENLKKTYKGYFEAARKAAK